MRWLLIVLLLAGCLGQDLSADPPTDVPGASTLDDPVLAATGRWLEPFEGQIPAVSMALMPDGRIIYWSGVEGTANASATDVTFFTVGAEAAQARILDLSTDPPTIEMAEQPDDLDLFCAGLTWLPDGTLVTAGGTHYQNLQDAELAPLSGERRTRSFDPEIGTWTEGPDLLLDRWYPSVFLHDGHAVAASGIGDLANPDQHWTGWESLDEEWSMLPDTDHRLPLYPRLFTLPGGDHAGDAFYTTSATLWGPFGEHPEEAEWSLHQAWGDDGWTTWGPSLLGARQYAASVLLPYSEGDVPTFLTAGGTLQRSTVATDLVEITDVDGEPVSRLGESMHHARWHHNAVLLPDGHVLMVGGGQYDNVIAHGQENLPVLEAEWFDPDTEAWTELAAMTVPRMYHSTALLLPDGRVLAGGHVPLPNPFEPVRQTANPQTVETRFEVYEPPYLFRGERPVILDAPDTITHGQVFDVETGGHATGAVLVRPGATTHAYDSSQRVIELDVEPIEGGLRVVAPSGDVVFPKGPAMLFVTSDHADGPTPSEAAWVTLA